MGSGIWSGLPGYFHFRDQILRDQVHPATGTKDNTTSLRVDEARLEYTYEVMEGLEIRPGYFSRKAAYESIIFLGEEYEIESTGYGLRLDFKKDQFRAIAAVRQDTFAHNDQSSPSHQAVLSYKLSDQQIVRLVSSKSSRFPNYFDAFLNQDFPPPVGVKVIANKDLDLPEFDQIELGCRGQFGEISVDTEIYRMTGKNFIRFFTVIPSSSAADGYNVDIEARNEETIATQNGITTSLSIRPPEQLVLKAHFTVQHTDREALIADDLNLPDIGWKPYR